MEYAYKPKGKSAKTQGSGLRVSKKASMSVCRAINKKSLQKAKALLSSIAEGSESLDGKYYTNATKEVLSLLESAERNAEASGLDTTRLIVHAAVHKGFSYYTPKRFKLRGRKKKLTNVQIVLEQK